MTPTNMSKNNRKHRPIGGPIFFYSDACQLCEPALKKVVPIFIEQDIQLVVRKPYPTEMNLPGFSFPALLLPRGVFDNEKPILFVGSEIDQALLALITPEEEEDLSPWLNKEPLN